MRKLNIYTNFLTFKNPNLFCEPPTFDRGLHLYFALLLYSHSIMILNEFIIFCVYIIYNCIKKYFFSMLAKLIQLIFLNNLLIN